MESSLQAIMATNFSSGTDSEDTDSEFEGELDLYNPVYAQIQGYSGEPEVSHAFSST